MTKIITTERLVLRRHRANDAPAIARLIADWDVIKWLVSPPYPYTLAHAEEYTSDGTERESYAITQDGCYLGNVGLRANEDGVLHDLGYWLGVPFHGQGLMTEAVVGLLTDHFDNGGSDLTSGYLPGNEASKNVLTKVGFRETELVMRDSVPLGKKMALQAMGLTRADWERRHG